MRIILIFLLVAFSVNIQAIEVVLVNPSLKGNPFWDRVSDAFIAAAEDLSFNSQVLYGNDDRLSYYQALESLLTQHKKPDYILLSPYSGNAVATFNLLEKYQIPFITLERTLAEEEQVKLGVPGEKYKYWLGEIYHDNVQAGRLLSDTLLAFAKNTNSPKQIRLIGLSGSHSGESSFRVLGLRQSVARHQQTELLQVVPAYWSMEKAKDIYTQLQERYGNIDVVWAASDGMALGALLAEEKALRKSSLIAGGIDWTKEAIQAIEDGKLNASVGGHFFQGAFALVNLYNYVHGMPSAFIGVNNINGYELGLITKDNIDRYRFLKDNINWDSIDFKTLTQVEQGNNHQGFTVEGIIKLFTR